MLIALTPTLSARKVPAREFSPRLKMRHTVASIAQRTIVGCLCSVPSGDTKKDTLNGPPLHPQARFVHVTSRLQKPAPSGLRATFPNLVREELPTTQEKRESAFQAAP